MGTSQKEVRLTQRSQNVTWKLRKLDHFLEISPLFVNFCVDRKTFSRIK